MKLENGNGQLAKNSYQLAKKKSAKMNHEIKKILPTAFCQLTTYNVTAKKS
jgi:hypothetical protein